MELVITKHRKGKYGSIRTQQVWKRSNGKCWYCGCQMQQNATGKENDNIFTFDHLIPTSRGGSKDLDNLVGSCKKCNNLKSDGTVGFLRMKLLAMRNHWPKFNQLQYEFLVSRGVDLSKFGRHEFYFERQGLK